jgi:hypothetical protein
MESWWQWSYALGLGVCLALRFLYRPQIPVSWNEVRILRPSEIPRTPLPCGRGSRGRYIIVQRALAFG